MSGPTDIAGVFAGHWTHDSGSTGSTALLFPGGAVAGHTAPGSATGSREIGVLEAGHLTPEIHGICLSGGSAFGLAAADGVVEVLAEQGVGFHTPGGAVPIVPGAILYDLERGPFRPNALSGRLAAEAASSHPLAEGRVGAGAGCTVAKLIGLPLPGGLGCATIPVGEYTVAAVVAVNALGSVRDPETGAFVAGEPPAEWLRSGGGAPLGAGQHTSLAVVVTDAPLTKGAAGVLAKMGAAGFARCFYPAFSAFDGDTVFAASPAKGPCVDPLTLTRLGHAGAVAISRAIVRGVTQGG